MITIYLIANKVNGKIYVGQTKKTVEIRFKEHCRSAFHFKDKRHFPSAIRKHGSSSFLLFKLGLVVSKPEANDWEKYWISFLSPEYNKTLGGDGGSPMLGIKHSEHTKFLISQANKRRYEDPVFCQKMRDLAIERFKKHPEIGAKISLAQKGKRISLEQRAKISTTLKGSKYGFQVGHEVSEEIRKKISLTKFLKTVAYA